MLLKYILKIQVCVPDALVGQNTEIWCLEIEKSLFDLVKMKGWESKISQIRPPFCLPKTAKVLWLV